jgi:hypothetical protein
MYAETFTFFGIFILILLIFAEFGKHKIIGVMASLLLIMAGIWVGGDNITFQTGSATAISETATTAGNETTITRTEALTNTYAPITIPYTPIAFNILLALVLVSVGLYGTLFYALNLLAFTPAR